MDSVSLREHLLELAKPKPEEFQSVTIEGREVFFRTLSMAEYMGIDFPECSVDHRERLIAASACEQDGKPIFTPADVAVLSKLKYPIVRKLWKAAEKANPVNDAEVEQVKND